MLLWYIDFSKQFFFQSTLGNSTAQCQRVCHWSKTQKSFLQHSKSTPLLRNRTIKWLKQKKKLHILDSVHSIEVLLCDLKQAASARHLKIYKKWNSFAHRTWLIDLLNARWSSLAASVRIWLKLLPRKFYQLLLPSVTPVLYIPALNCDGPKRPYTRSRK